MAEKQNTPEIRFEGFTDPWEQRKLGELCELNPTAVLPDSFEYVDLESVAGTDMISHRREEKLTAPSRAQRLASFGDIFYQTVRPYQKNNYFYELPDEDYVFSTGYAQLRPLCDGRFLFSSLQRDQFVSCVLEHCTGTSYPAINANDLAALFLAVPIDAEEQRLVGSILKPIDSLITLHQRKHDKLCTVKKSMLDKMFPKPGETEPEIRFKGFTDPWEQRKFADFVTASGIRNSENLDLPSYSVTNDRGFVPQDEQFENGGTMREADKTSYWIVEPNSFAYNPARINVGSIGYQSTGGNVIVSSLYEVFRTDETCDDHFLWHWFKTRLFTQQIEMLQEGGVRLYFFFDKLLKSGISMPSVDEQRLIGEQFDWLDSLITLHQRKCPIFCFCAHGSRTNFVSILQG